MAGRQPARVSGREGRERSASAGDRVAGGRRRPTPAARAGSLPRADQAAVPRRVSMACSKAVSASWPRKPRQPLLCGDARTCPRPAGPSWSRSGRRSRRPRALGAAARALAGSASWRAASRLRHERGHDGRRDARLGRAHRGDVLRARPHDAPVRVRGDGVGRARPEAGRALQHDRWRRRGRSGRPRRQARRAGRERGERHQRHYREAGGGAREHRGERRRRRGDAEPKNAAAA